LPGPGWQILATRLKGEKGPRGEKGERGERGDKGEPGIAPIIAGWEIDEVNYTAHAIMSDGSDGGTLNLRGMFERYHTEAR